MNNEQIAIIDKWLKILNDIGGDFYLPRVYQENTGVDIGVNRNDTNFLIMKSLLVNHGLIEPKPTNTFDAPERLTSLGKDIADSGGWKLYFKKQEDIKQVIEEDRKLTRQLAESTLRLNRFTKMMQIATLLVAMFASWVAYKEYQNDSSKQVPLSEHVIQLPPHAPVSQRVSDSTSIK